jgi:hypothetical protein
MRVHVDSPNAPSIDDDLASPLWRLRRRGAQTASDEREARQRASSMAKHFSSVCHYLRFPYQPIFLGFLSSAQASSHRGPSLHEPKQLA